VKWKFNKGDCVISKEHGPGIIASRDVRSLYVMDRPIKIVEREVYGVMFGKRENIVTVDSEDLSCVNSL
tara:strand:+ start:386 stop:592 length:207 start_codon:yes stop_codon:yes gene_type:complete